MAKTNCGGIGEDFVLRYLEQHGINAVEAESRVQAADMRILG